MTPVRAEETIRYLRDARILDVRDEGIWVVVALDNGFSWHIPTDPDTGFVIVHPRPQ